MFPNYHINRIRYFTALVESTPRDPSQRQRQLTYLRALETVPNLHIHYGRFYTTVRRRWLENVPPGSPPQEVEVIQAEEKGSDVNLATHLLVDGFDKDYEVAIVVSNDSDLLEPIKLVRKRLGLQVGILNPRKHTARDLQGQVDFYRQVRRGPLSVSQFPDTLTDANGTITKPPGW